jgi:uncharacterized protein
MIQFEWDKAKARTNRIKHGITFEEATTVFDDPYAIFQKDRVIDGELRWHAIGIASSMTVLLVAHTLRDPSEESHEVIRIISARLATRKEQILYDENRTKDIG